MRSVTNPKTRVEDQHQGSVECGEKTKARTLSNEAWLTRHGQLSRKQDRYRSDPLSTVPRSPKQQSDKKRVKRHLELIPGPQNSPIVADGPNHAQPSTTYTAFTTVGAAACCHMHKLTTVVLQARYNLSVTTVLSFRPSIRR